MVRQRNTPAGLAAAEVRDENVDVTFMVWLTYRATADLIDAALRRMLREAKERVADGRQIIIFPEGTRRAPGAPPDYKTGVVLLYDALKVPCVPVALNSGLVWPRRSAMGQ